MSSAAYSTIKLFSGKLVVLVQQRHQISTRVADGRISHPCILFSFVSRFGCCFVLLVDNWYSVIGRCYLRSISIIRNHMEPNRNPSNTNQCGTSSARIVQ